MAGKSGGFRVIRFGNGSVRVWFGRAGLCLYMVAGPGHIKRIRAGSGSFKLDPAKCISGWPAGLGLDPGLTRGSGFDFYCY